MQLQRGSNTTTLTTPDNTIDIDGLHFNTDYGLRVAARNGTIFTNYITTSHYDANLLTSASSVWQLPMPQKFLLFIITANYANSDRKLRTI